MVLLLSSISLYCFILGYFGIKRRRAWDWWFRPIERSKRPAYYWFYIIAIYWGLALVLLLGAAMIMLQSLELFPRPAGTTLRGQVFEYHFSSPVPGSPGIDTPLAIAPQEALVWENWTLK